MEDPSIRWRGRWFAWIAGALVSAGLAGACGLATEPFGPSGAASSSGDGGHFGPGASHGPGASTGASHPGVGGAGGTGGTGGRASGGPGGGGGGVGGAPGTGGNGAVTSTTESSSTGPPPPTCTDKYGTAPGFYLCVETATSCDFNVDTGGTQSCDDVCRALGGQCLDAFDNLGPCDLFSTTDVLCNDAHYSTTLCRCSL